MLDYNEKVRVYNKIGSEVSFAALTGNKGDVVIPCWEKSQKNKSYAILTVEEILAQIQSKRNKLFLGIDMHGSHAPLWIDSLELREELEFTSQEQISPEMIEEMLDIKNDRDFLATLRKRIVTVLDKQILLDYWLSDSITNKNRYDMVKEFLKIDDTVTR